MGATVGGGSAPSYKNVVVGTSHTPSLLNYEPSKMGSNQNLMQNNANFYSPSPMEEENRTNTTTKKYKKNHLVQNPNSSTCIPQTKDISHYEIQFRGMAYNIQYMQEHAVICKFMGLFYSKKALLSWINTLWKPK
jgi:hypothetical protein